MSSNFFGSQGGLSKGHSNFERKCTKRRRGGGGGVGSDRRWGSSIGLSRLELELKRKGKVAKEENYPSLTRAEVKYQRPPDRG